MNESKTLNTIQLLESLIESGQKLTPMMEQYYQIKKQYQDTLLLFRMGDFYEVFFDDAKAASHLLNIALTHRGKIADTPIPMAGIPHHAAATYIDRITSQGLKAAICEQVEDPKEAKGIVKRAVTQVVSPGMPFDIEKAEKRNNRFIASAYFDEVFYLSFIDFTTGEFFGTTAVDEASFIENFQLYAPKEYVTHLGQWEDFPIIEEFLQNYNVLKTNLTSEYFQVKYSDIYIERLIPSFKRDEVLKAHSPILNCIGALSFYICSTQSLEELIHIRPFKLINENEKLKVTYPTLIGLEILPSSRQEYTQSVIGFLDKTKTSMGTRKLKQLFLNPLQELSQIMARQEAISILHEQNDLLENLRELLKEVRDIERVMAKITSKKANGGDLINLAQAIQIYFEIDSLLKKNFSKVLPKLTNKQKDRAKVLSEIIVKTINDEIGATLEKGNLIKVGANKSRDRLAKRSQNKAEVLSQLEAKYRQKTGISNLRIKSNNVAGYFIEVSKSHIKKVPKSFHRKQTLVNSERYLTDELIDFEKELVSAKDKLYKLEKSIFDDLLLSIQEHSSEIIIVADYLSLIDCFQSFAFVAKQNDFVKPSFVKTKKILEIKGAWHPLIKANIKDHFVPHNLKLDSNQYFGLITGPNMAGKTTVMREMAIIQFLAQVGSFVPALSAKLGLCDYLFSRLGASDDIVRGQSTFMVEMSETAEIIRHATDKSFIILDEIGRGTSTYDGLSIAWALVEYLNEQTKALALFSTHYHELIDLVKELKTAKNLTVKTVNYKGKVQFLYTLIEEGATQSFGIHVAELAGLPREILIARKKF
jgi:DNA mismatch repair protein MutS